MKRVHTAEADTRREDGQAPEALPVEQGDNANRQELVNMVLGMNDSQMKDVISHLVEALSPPIHERV